MCNKLMLTINIDATVGNLSYSAKNESHFTDKKSFFFFFRLTSFHEQ